MTGGRRCSSNVGLLGGERNAMRLASVMSFAPYSRAVLWGKRAEMS